jgi:hypothetical protein
LAGFYPVGSQRIPGNAGVLIDAVMDTVNRTLTRKFAYAAAMLFTSFTQMVKVPVIPFQKVSFWGRNIRF